MESLRHVQALDLQLQVRGTGRAGVGEDGRVGGRAGRAAAIDHLAREEPRCQGDEPWPF